MVLIELEEIIRLDRVEHRAALLERGKDLAFVDRVSIVEADDFQAH
jgi:hypothetical protein